MNEEVLVKSTENSSAVTSLDTYDLSGDGKDDLLVGRRDGTVQVYSLPSEENEIDNEIRLVYNEVLYEGFRAIVNLYEYSILILVHGSSERLYI